VTGLAEVARSAPAEWAPARWLQRDLTGALRVIAFAALAAFVTSAWLGMVVDPPSGRGALVVAIMAGAAAAMSLLGARRLPRPATYVLGGAIALLAVALGTLALGVPLRLLMPWHWAELAANLDYGLGGLWSVDYPYSASTGWTRLVILLGLPVVLGVAVVLAFRPVRQPGPRLSMSALVVLVIAYGTATTTAPPGDPLLHGLWLLLLVSAWLWLPGLGPRQGLLGGGLILVAGLLALPLAAAVDGGKAWVDYKNWGASHATGPTESFTWDQAYGPLTWPRVGRPMLHVQSDAPYYWRAAVLDEFDGTSWVQSDSSGIGALQLPARPADNEAGPRLNPAWIHDLTYTVDRLRSDLVVAAGTPLSPPRLDGLTVMERGMLLPSDEALGEGDSYTVRSYVPDPTLAQMRHASRRYPAALARDTQITLPTGRSLTMPLWGAPSNGTAERALAGSAYGGVYALARRITAGQSTPYGAVRAIENYLGAHYRYSEFAPISRLALRKFLLHDPRGYCQHFSGAMALMLRMLGVPARVAAGFSPGRAESGDYVVTDFDSHAWVEVYFNRIGWVTFDPTPAAAPAHSRTSGLGAPTAAPSSQRGDLGNRRRATNGTADSDPHHGSAPGGSDVLGVPWAWAALLAGLLAAGALVTLRRRTPGTVPGPEAQLREVVTALARVRSWDVRGSTLLALERRLEAEAGPGAAAYMARLRALRYEAGDPRPPAARERAIMRREVSAGLGLRHRIRAIAAIPPWGPAHRACKPPFRPAP